MHLPVNLKRGNAFQNDVVRNSYVKGALTDRTNTKFVLGTEFKRRNFISHHQFRECLKRGYLVGIRRGGAWQVASCAPMKEEMLHYLGMDALLYDADN